tara:strand:- start:149 stop:790 length:642 start_codon:yes stop_codon:yes gene_type:complete
MAKRSSKERALRRKQMLRAWEPFSQVHSLVSDSLDSVQVERQLKANGTTVWENNRYLVHREPVPSDQHGFGDIEVVWLSIKARDDTARHDWREFQWIKNELCGEDWEAIELYPSEKRMIDSVNQFHLWCLSPPAVFPVGWWNRKVVEENTTAYGSQRKWEDNRRPDDLMSEKEAQEEIKALADLIRGGNDISKMSRSEAKELYDKMNNLPSES